MKESRKKGKSEGGGGEEESLSQHAAPRESRRAFAEMRSRDGLFQMGPTTLPLPRNLADG